MVSSEGQVTHLAAEAAFVFVGKVIKPRAATMESLAGENTAVVEIERVISAPAMFASLAGHRITARFEKASSIKVGSTRIFFANGWVFGQSIAVDVVETLAEMPTARAVMQVRDGHEAMNERVLKERLDSATLGVAGRVAKIAKCDKGTTHISEHDPNWREATIEVDEVVKGNKEVKQVTVLFPSSDDVRWHRVAKYAPGQQGVWLLQPGRQQDAKGIPPKQMAAVPPEPDVLTALHPYDYLPLDELVRVKALAGK